MLLEELQPIHDRFTVADLHFKAEDFEPGENKAFFSVKDSGGLEVGRFCAWCDDDMTKVEYDDSDSEGLLERLRKTGETNAIARNVRRTLESMR